MDRAIFFQHVRNDPFSGSMTKAQVAGIDALLDAWPASITVPQMAYVLATVFHETGARMQPVREGFKATDAAARAYVKRQRYRYAEPDPITGHVYYGRGHVQLTWAKNYRTMSERLDVDMYHEPDLMLRPDISIRVLFDGMEHGFFTGKGLQDYFSGKRADPVGARRIINGTDRAGLVAGYYQGFLTALQAASGEHVVIPAVERTTPAPRYPEELKPLGQSKTIIGSGIATTATVSGAVADQLNNAETAQDAIGTAQEAIGYTMGVWEWAGLVMAVLALVGVGIVLWSKWDRRRKGID